MNQSPRTDVAIVGGGHNGLVAACYLAKAGLSVAVFEQNVEVGGATVSQQVFPDFDARLSRYAYLVSLLPDQIVEELDLQFETISRGVASFTPEFHEGSPVGLLVASEYQEQARASFRQLCGSDSEFEEWRTFYDEIHHMAQALAPTLLQPLPSKSEVKELIGKQMWHDFLERPIGEVIERRFSSDVVRGVILTDGLIGTFSDAHSIAANRCFLYHLIGNGSGEWKVPRGGMGGIVRELKSKAEALGVAITTEFQVSSIRQSDSGFTVTAVDGRVRDARFVLANCAPATLATLIDLPAPETLEGSQVKINMLLRRLPRLKSGMDPRIAFAGTFHFDERYSDLQQAFTQASNGEIPSRIPAEMYCHTLTDPSILSKELQDQGYQTLTLFALHTPASLFDADNEGAKRIVKERLLSQLNEYLLDPIEECFAIASDGTPCIEVKSPLDIEESVGLPRGNIFHKDLSFPFREDGTPRSWGVETSIPGLFLCGAGAIRGGGVSGIPGRNAASAVLELQRS